MSPVLWAVGGRGSRGTGVGMLRSTMQPLSGSERLRGMSCQGTNLVHCRVPHRARQPSVHDREPSPGSAGRKAVLTARRGRIVALPEWNAGQCVNARHRLLSASGLQAHAASTWCRDHHENVAPTASSAARRRSRRLKRNRGTVPLSSHGKKRCPRQPCGIGRPCAPRPGAPSRGHGIAHRLQGAVGPPGNDRHRGPMRSRSASPSASSTPD